MHLQLQHTLRTSLRFLQHIPSPTSPTTAATLATGAPPTPNGQDDEDNDDAMVGRILSRREVLGLLGAAGATTLLAACSGSSDDTTSAPTATTAAATGAAPGTSTTTSNAPIVTVTPTATTTEAAATEPVSEPTTVGTEAATEAAVEPTEAATEAVAESTVAETLAELPLPACVVSPELTEGPYFVDTQLNRSDVRTDPDTGTAVAGAPLELALRVSSFGSDGCVALAGAMVDIWQCDAEGTYSAVNDTMEGFNTVGQQFLRGYQTSDESGIVRFQTIYPGWYRGRAVHIHFKVRTEDADGQAFEFTSQFFFDDTLSDEVFLQEPYASKGERDLRNESDGIYNHGGSELLLDVMQTADDSGYEALFDIGIATT